MMSDVEQYAVVGGLISIGVLIFFIVKVNEISKYLKDIRDKMPDNKIEELTDDGKLKPGDVVVLSSGKQSKIKGIENGKYSCYSNNGMFHDGDFSESELKRFGK